ncbi:NotI family restriction endonuclease [Rhodococcus fascians]|uniref:NotI family restriction endonuclease n=1 Tax=Rhodococcoides fascians TaxID=1828 RepID=UPI0024B78B7A|nr:NotI family restriction endonuclease [Rhodococcus fascians]MDJ0004332.1 NotI family restriction endonuclease [Rhodococcus fascians]
MAGEIYEWFGFRAADRSVLARESADAKRCPFVDGPCTKTGGVCSVKLHQSQEIVPVCPKRLYFRGHEFLREIAQEAFSGLDLILAPDGLPNLLPGSDLKTARSEHGKFRAGAFGQGWAAEIRLPAAIKGGARYSVDFTVVAVDETSELVSFVLVEVQTIDTTGSYKVSLDALNDDREIVSSNIGMNWENVNKRILPQLIIKGLMLQAERFCKTGIYFATPESVYRRLVLRLGGEDRLRQIPKQPGSITFMRYRHDIEAASLPGAVVPLKRLPDTTISTSDMSLAFITPQNLPPGGAFEQEILKKI